MVRVGPQSHEKRNKKCYVPDFMLLVHSKRSLLVDVIAVCGSDPNLTPKRH